MHRCQPCNHIHRTSCNSIPMTSDYWRQVTIHMGMISHGRQHSGMIVWTPDGLYLVDCNTSIRMNDTLREVLKEGGNAGPSRAVPESGQTRNQIFSARPIPSGGQTPTDNVPEGGLSCPWTTQVSSAPTDTLSCIGIFATGVYAIYWWGFIEHHMIGVFATTTKRKPKYHGVFATTTTC